MNRIDDIDEIDEDNAKFEKIVENEKRYINKKLKIISSRLIRKFKNNFSQTLDLDRINKFIMNMRDTLNEL